MVASNGGALPMVDLAPFFAGDGAHDNSARARAIEAVRQAGQATGFFRAVNHGVPRELMARALDLSAAFFALPDEEKAKVRPAEASSNAPLPVGYARQPAHSADKNEYLLLFNPKLGLNHYPAEPAGLRGALEECFAKLADLGLLIQDILNECMGLPRGFLAEYNADRDFDFLTALRYFPATADENNGSSAHEDANCITFVLQDDVGGLEVLGVDGRWVPAEPVEGTIVVNVGDVLQVLTNKKFKSATHRVVRRPEAHRHSIVFFLNLHGDKWVEPLPEFAGDAGEQPRYRGFRYNEYMQLRMRNKSHPPSRPEDVVHITHYEI
ncbi:2-oxoglutarate-Fe(II) type oxidoreductase hxnY-like [Triticum dicoccoides]|uniref:2-oxoglutarate-Fe(II) type oxidoreductase hxnY-like n=1 Tax=Triticum dicoccoides TaxID=85692 RepID=UPI00188E5FEE|nr:2-oxoglutarate-Fe(II) type oxidoreductase hxnY-like [Triticum dicoccoides]